MNKDPRLMRIKLNGLPSECAGVLHFHPHAYCVCKPTDDGAAVVCPPQENRAVKGSEYGCSWLVKNKSAFGTAVGQWYSIAYCQVDGSWDNWILPHQPNAKEK